jgi:integrase
MASRQRRTPRRFGKIQQLPSGRFHASYTGPDGARHNGPHTFEVREDSEAWLADVSRAIRAGTWSQAKPTPDDAPPPILALYSAEWLNGREVKGRALRPRTVEHYEKLLDQFILPTFGPYRVDEIEPKDVRAWFTTLRDKTGTTYRAHAYSLLSAIMTTAVADGHAARNPCQIKGASYAPRQSKTKPASLDELDALVEAMPEKYRALVLLAAWCGLRFGEATELRRGDLDLDVTGDVPAGAVRVRRGVVRTSQGRQVGDTKSDAGNRDVAIPSHIVPELVEHLNKYAQPGRQGLVFPAPRSGGHLGQSTLTKAFYPAREAVGRPDLRFHDLRHTGLTLAAHEGATLAELMARAGHSTSSAAMKYQHSTEYRDQLLADKMAATAVRSRT